MIFERRYWRVMIWLRYFCDEGKMNEEIGEILYYERGK